MAQGIVSKMKKKYCDVNRGQLQYSDGSNICVKDFSMQYFRFFISCNLIRYPIVKFLVVDTISNLDLYMSRQMNTKGKEM